MARSSTFRLIVCAVILFCTAFFPILFIYPAVADRDIKYIVIAVTCFAALFEVILFVSLSNRMVYSKIGKATKTLQTMARDGEPIYIDAKAVDGDAEDLLASVNATAGEYARLAQTRKTFVANASHELRSPLTSIQGFLQAILDGTASPEDTDKYLNIALSETKRLNSLITSMLDLSRLESGKNPLMLVKFDINDVINEVIAKFEPALIKKTLQINAEFAKEICYVYADKDKIIRVVTNLIDNAIKYSPAYSRIIVTTSINDNKVFVSVRDFGYGISKKDQMLIWDTFFMSDRSRTPVKTKGSGLGLSIVKKIIDEHGEVIWVDSSRGAGATFYFSLTLFDSSKHKSTFGQVIKTSDGESEQTEK